MTARRKGQPALPEHLGIGVLLLGTLASARLLTAQDIATLTISPLALRAASSPGDMERSTGPGVFGRRWGSMASRLLVDSR